MRCLIVLCLMVTLMAASGALAQEAAPTATPVGPLWVPSATFTPSPTPGFTPSPEGDDPRLVVCGAPFQRGWFPYRVYRHDRLADLLVGVDGLTITQVAALNCLDDPAALPVGAVIWLPPGAAAGIAPGEAGDRPTRRATIFEFSASARQVQNIGPGISFRWRAEGRTAYFYICPPEPEKTCERPLDARPVPLEYVTPAIGGFYYVGPVRYRLEVLAGDDYTDPYTFEDVTVEVVCTHDAMGEVAGYQTCPVEPIRYVPAAWQAFENGVMMWLGDRREIWVMTYDGHLRVYADRYQEGDPDPTAVPPKGLAVPIRGFGRLWAELGGAESVLGWATGGERGYQAGWQAAGRYSYTTYVGGASGIIYAITLPPGSQTGYWAQVRG
ncbi:MAG: hypothetical protein BroJett038_14060 [Chloroflexota bacterium]|nr:MAG: hypothetical protein BroJett038_14060 [Chloroflexota bacterium]